MITLKFKKFLEGWNAISEGVMFPNGRYDKDLKKIVTWDEILEHLTVFEAKELGKKEALSYLKSSELKL